MTDRQFAVVGTLDTKGFNHCRECGGRADVVRYDTFHKLVEYRTCEERAQIPKRCASAFGEFQERVKRLRQEQSSGGPTDG